jgi:CRISPR-associated protein Csm4
MTRQLKIIYLKPLGGYKTELRSDTLWGLLCWGIRHLYGEKRLESFLSSYTEGSPEWIISSTFPYKQDGNRRIPFFPKPFLPDTNQVSGVSEKERLRLRKQVKKMFWLEQTDFEKTLKGELKQADFIEQAKQEIPSDTTKVPPREQRSITMHNNLRFADFKIRF